MRYAFLFLVLLAGLPVVAMAAPVATLTVTAYVDLNGNGVQDGNDPPKSNIDWIVTNDRSVYRCTTSNSGTCSLSLTAGRWYFSAYRGFDMVFDGDMQLDSDATVSAAIEPEAVYLPLVAR